MPSPSTTEKPNHDQDAFLRSRPHVIVATIMKDGRPQLTPAWFLWDGERFWVSTLDWTVKVKNALRDPRVTLCVDGADRHSNYVQVFGTAEIVEGDVRERTLDLIRKYEPIESDALAHWERIKDDRVLLVVTPQRFQWRHPS
jgi:PPOX class probable F420-dependent enzyme